MSNSQPCQGQRRISPSRVYSIAPGSVDCVSPISGPSHNAAPWCGQRFKRPRNSPLMLNTAIGRSSMAAMGPLLALHLGVVFALFITMPYGKFVHGIYRYAALVRYARERRMMAGGI